VTKKRRVNEAPFRRAVMAARGEHCRVCGSSQWVQAAHVWSKGRGGPTVVENGIPLCQPHHTAYDSSRLRLRREHLDPDQVEWLRQKGWVDWDADGQPIGRGCRLFEPVNERLHAIRAAAQQEGGTA
jgi:hypothetical protein